MTHHHQHEATIRISFGERHYLIGILRNLEGQKHFNLSQIKRVEGGQTEERKQVEIPEEDLARIMDALQVAKQLGAPARRQVMNN